jgi:hypothetical protein
MAVLVIKDGELAAAEEVVIHEMLHTVGLGEWPPTSRQIDGTVASRCAS